MGALASAARAASRTVCAGALLLATAAGCSRQDFSRPTVHNPLSHMLDSGKAYVPPGKSTAEVRMERMTKALAAHRSQPAADAGDYRLGPGDALKVGIFALEEPGKTAFLDRTVSERGHVTLPYIGKIQAGGVSARDLEQQVVRAYAGKYIVDPQITVSITDYRSVAVTVAGSVDKPGVYYLRRNQSTVLEMLAQAGGLTEESGDAVLLVRAEGTKAPQDPDAATEAAEAAAENGRAVAVDLKELIDEGNLLVNLRVGNGDIVTVPPRPKAFVYVLGYVRRPGAYELKDGMQVDALRAVALGGGLNSDARASNSTLIRETPTGHTAVAIDLIKIAHGLRPSVYLQPGDTLVVGSGIDARLAEYIKPRATLGATAGF